MNSNPPPDRGVHPCAPALILTVVLRFVLFFFDCGFNYPNQRKQAQMCVIFSKVLKLTLPAHLYCKL